ncbi:MAG: hypothetical protein UHE93_04380, partial [Muribaculaceae bacterium]|nr:hypothetical protein [Muribaculaceae bacterium]
PLLRFTHCYAQGPGPFADYRLGTVTPSLAAYIFLAAKAMSLQSAKSMEEQQKAESLLSPRCPLLYSLSRSRKWDSAQSHCYRRSHR